MEHLDREQAKLERADDRMGDTTYGRPRRGGGSWLGRPRRHMSCVGGGGHDTLSVGPRSLLLL